MANFTRQQQRQATRMLHKGRFPFPDLLDWFIGYVKPKNEVFAQIQEDGRVLTNLSGETEYFDIVEFRSLLENLKDQDENPVDN